MTNSHQKQDLIRFDWAINRLLRNPANFGVLEGFLSTLLRQDITVLNVEYTQSTRDPPSGWQVCVDVIVKNDKGETFVIEVLNCYEYDYLCRMRFYASTPTPVRVKGGDDNGKVIPKRYYVSIVYFDLGTGKDYIYIGQPEFRSFHRLLDALQLSEKESVSFKRAQVGDIVPEHYLIRVKNFDNDTKNALDQWIYFLKNGAVRRDFDARGISLARDVLQYDLLTPKERNSYDHYLDCTRYEINIIEDARHQGQVEGRAERLAEGEAKEKLANARGMKSHGIPLATIAKITGLPLDQLEKL